MAAFGGGKRGKSEDTSRSGRGLAVPCTPASTRKWKSLFHKGRLIDSKVLV
jgi:hypothetical protein